MGDTERVSRSDELNAAVNAQVEAAKEFVEGLLHLRPTITPRDACEALGLSPEGLGAAQALMAHGYAEAENVPGMPVEAQLFHLGFQLGTAWGVRRAGRVVESQGETATRQPFTSCRELAEAILSRDERIKEGELYWAVAMGVSIAGCGGKPRREVLMAIATEVDNADTASSNMTEKAAYFKGLTAKG